MPTQILLDRTIAILSEDSGFGLKTGSEIPAISINPNALPSGLNMAETALDQKPVGVVIVNDLIFLLFCVRMPLFSKWY